MPTRRQMLTVLGAGVLTTTGFACSGSGGETLRCTQVQDLTPPEQSLRNAQAYSDRATVATRACRLCRFYVAPTATPACGTCTVIKGPVHPEGSCNLFTAS